MKSSSSISTEMANSIELWPIERLKPYERNARTHSVQQVQQIANSIAEFGFTNPILVEPGRNHRRPCALARSAPARPHTSAGHPLVAGSGSTLIACEKTKRRGRMIEIDPIYIDVIIRRWQDYTGGSARRVSDQRPFDEVSTELAA